MLTSEKATLGVTWHATLCCLSRDSAFYV